MAKVKRAPDSVDPNMRTTSEKVSSPVSTPEEALAYVGQTGPITMPKSMILAKNEPARVQGYEKLGEGGPPHTGKPYGPKVKENRGGGTA